MYYCERCHWLNVKDICENCHTKSLREVHQDDYCFLVEKEMLWAEALKEILDNHEIPYVCESIHGSAMALRVAPLREDFQFYVPYKYYLKAKELIEKMFQESD